MSQGVSKTRAEVKELEKLRQLFLDAPKTEGLLDYWQDPDLLELYDKTFARRIGWKWSSVVSELSERLWYPSEPITRWVDWGCGTGVAAEIAIGAFRSHLPHEILLTDRSARARKFAQMKAMQHAPSLAIRECVPHELEFARTDLVLLSHVLTELTTEQFQTLTQQLLSAGTLIWVEPGTPFCSRRLVQVRKELSQHFHVVAPCPHQGICGAQDSEKDWCHLFAVPPKEVFQDPDWARFSKALNIDLRSLPTSFLVLEHKSLRQRNASSLSHEGTCLTKQRMIARPRFYKGHAKCIVCNESGLKEISLSEKDHKKQFKEWQRNCFFVEFTNAQDFD
jgi:ribosomal protein RSM22 (predicted rRNA methylase)